jgi:hypothetical protein
MARRFRAVAPALAALAILALPAPALAHEGNPNYRSDIDPPPAGVSARMLNYDDTLELEVEPGREALVLGYENEPYVRYLADGTVEVNQRAPTRYLNEDRYADVDVPAVADAKAKPDWQRVAAQGRYAWHDHRVHYMVESLPPTVTDESAETKIFDWQVPLVIGGERERLTGTLYWDPVEGGGVSAALAAGLGAAVVASLALAVWRIRARRRADGDEPDASGSEREAW